MISFRKNVKGFTLIELLIVVAIIGVLATLSVPSFKKMVQKAKKSEAKVALGALYTAETAFRSEYNTYGNSLDKLGFDLEGPAGSRIYAVGFPTATCANPTSLKPLVTSTEGQALQKAYPDYYTATPNYFFQAGKMPGACELGDVVDNGITFTASASGLISPQLPAGDTFIDAWTINENRVLANTKDGMK